MTSSTKRALLRWMHILFSVPICGYIYTPFDELPGFAPIVRYFFLPILAASGIWLWKGPAIRRLILRRPTQPVIAEN